MVTYIVAIEAPAQSRVRPGGHDAGKNAETYINMRHDESLRVQKCLRGRPRPDRGENALSLASRKMEHRRKCSRERSRVGGLNNRLRGVARENE